MKTSTAIITTLFLITTPVLAVPNAPATPAVDFARDIQPVLQASCYGCHGAQATLAGLRLDVRDAAFKGGTNGKAILPGNSAGSRLVQRLLGTGGARMPLGMAPLPPARIALIRRWIDQGASWPDAAAQAAIHWAYRKPVRPPLAVVKNRSWVRNPIDTFVLARLETEGLKPAPVASREALIRRVSLDLIGLPPTLKEVDDFLADKSSMAWEKVVDRLLASPHYGERWAGPWLDLARYADTNGYEKDSRRNMWPYRDWVINAFNRDMPFNEFTIEQIAGDMLPHATPEQKIASGFNRNTMYNDEGGVDREEQRWLTIVDRVGTTASVWLGSTLACAECHNHKYDPFTQKDFYGLFAFYENSDEPELKLANGTTTLVMQEKPSKETPSTYLRIKGSFLNRGEKVLACTPACLPPLKKNWPLNRLGLAQWLVDEDNPLTARVTVNRIWERYFGHGIVDTTEDFGTQGEMPTHPELLDWLATELMRRGWSLKAIHRLIVTSATYRQASRVTPDLLERDPYNRLLARGPRFRIEAELIRDVALTASGELSPKIGGPSVFPFQPEGIWSIPYNGDEWKMSEGEDRFRRGIYTFWRRTSPYPAFVTFDAPSREFCTIRRSRTNTPLQALATLNDMAFVTVARDLARRMLREGGEGLVPRLRYGFRLCTTRNPTPSELSRLAALYGRERVHFGIDTKAAAKLMGEATPPADVAALTVVANVLLNLDETLTKE